MLIGTTPLWCCALLWLVAAMRRRRRKEAQRREEDGISATPDCCAADDIEEGRRSTAEVPLTNGTDIFEGSLAGEARGSDRPGHLTESEPQMPSVYEGPNEEEDGDKSRHTVKQKQIIGAVPSAAASTSLPSSSLSSANEDSFSLIELPGNHRPSVALSPACLLPAEDQDDSSSRLSSNVVSLAEEQRNTGSLRATRPRPSAAGLPPYPQAVHVVEAKGRAGRPCGPAGPKPLLLNHSSRADKDAGDLVSIAETAAAAAVCDEVVVFDPSAAPAIRGDDALPGSHSAPGLPLESQSRPHRRADCWDDWPRLNARRQLKQQALAAETIKDPEPASLVGLARDILAAVPQRAPAVNGGGGNLVETAKGILAATVRGRVPKPESYLKPMATSMVEEASAVLRAVAERAAARRLLKHSVSTGGCEGARDFDPSAFTNLAAADTEAATRRMAWGESDA